MAGERNFYHAVFKRLQCAAGSIGGGHFAANDDAAPLGGGFSLASINHPNGILGELGPGARAFGLPIQPGWRPINLVSDDPNDSPLYVLLKASLDGAPPREVQIGNQSWPVMPLGGTDMTYWQQFNAGSPTLIEALADWIATGDKVDDSPTSFELTYEGLAQNPPPAFPLQDENLPILYVASFKSDDGRRPGDQALPSVPANHVPDNFWATSRITLTDAAGKPAHPLTLKPGEEYCVTAVIGNCGNTIGGRRAFEAPPIHVVADAQAFNTFLGPGVKLPSLGNLDPADPNTTYEQYSLLPGQRDVVGFRFNIDTVFAGLETALAEANINLGGATPAQWLANSHPCLKVRIVSGEPDNKFTPAGGRTGGTGPALDADPRLDRHIAQHNLAPFPVTTKGARQIRWTNFIVAQSGATEANKLFLRHSPPGDGFALCLTMPTATYDAYVKAGGLSGWEVVQDLPTLAGPGANLPFPDCVVLREIENGAPLTVGNHHGERFLGMSLGIAWDPARLKQPFLSDTVTVSQSGPTGEIVGGFTLGLQIK